jgi:hypothetical protein
MEEVKTAVGEADPLAGASPPGGNLDCLRRGAALFAKECSSSLCPVDLVG